MTKSFLKKSQVNLTSFISPLNPIKESELALVHPQEFIDQIHNSRYMLACATEVPLIAVCPLYMIRSKLLTPLKWQTAGSVLASYLALKNGWAINLGGGFHHCSANSAGGKHDYLQLLKLTFFPFLKDFAYSLI